jgi:hypothetical protein
MKPTVALGIAMLVAGLPLAAAAQSPSTPSTGDLQMQSQHRRSVVLPKPSQEQMRQDADAAVSDYAATRGTGKVVRETSPVRPSARPDLNYDVTNGIQSQRLNDALRGR